MKPCSAAVLSTEMSRLSDMYAAYMYLFWARGLGLWYSLTWRRDTRGEPPGEAGCQD
jgi:hypothetical protein